MVHQVTTFKCGGFVVGVTFNHALHDGISYGELFINLLALAQEGPLVTTPYLDRTMLRASNTYQRDSDLAIAAAEFFALPGAKEDDQDLDQTSGQADNLNPSMNQMVSEIFPFTERDLLTLQREATEGGLVSSASRFDVLAAHIYKALTMAKESDPKRVSRLVYAVDFRKRIEPPLPKGFTGNATVAAQVRYLITVFANLGLFDDSYASLSTCQFPRFCPFYMTVFPYTVNCPKLL